MSDYLSELADLLCEKAITPSIMKADDIYEQGESYAFYHAARYLLVNGCRLLEVRDGKFRVDLWKDGRWVRIISDPSEAKVLLVGLKELLDA